MVVQNPQREQTFGHEPENALLVGIVILDVNFFFNFEENLEKPFAVFLEFTDGHDKHVAVVKEIGANEKIVEIVQKFRGQLLYYLVEVPEVHADVGVFISGRQRCLEGCLWRDDYFSLGEPSFNLFFVEVVIAELVYVLDDAAAGSAVLVEGEVAAVMV